MKTFIIILFFLFTYNSFSENDIDNIEKMLSTKSEVEQLKILNVEALKIRTISPKQSIIYGLRALDLSKKLNDKKAEAEACKNITAGYYYISNYEKALEYYRYSLKLYNKISDKKGVAGALNGIGLIYRIMKNYESAKEYYEEALKITEEIYDKQGIAGTLNNLGILYHLSGDNSKATKYFEKSLKIKEAIGDKNGIANTMNNLGMVYSDIGNENKSLDYYMKSLKIKEELNDKNGIAGNMINIGSCYRRIFKYNIAIDYISKAVKLSEKEGLKSSMLSGYISLAETYSIIGNYKLAMDYYKLYIEIKDRTFNEEISKKLAEFEARFEIEKQKKENEILRKENEYQTQVRTYLIIISSLVLLLAFVIYSRYQSKRKANNLLTLKNQEITEQSNQLSEAFQNLERKSNELDHQYKILQNLMDSIPNPVFFKDTEMKYTGCNKEFEKFAGRDKDELIGHSAFDYAAKDVAEMTNRMDTEILETPGIQKYEAKVLDGYNREMDVIYYKTRFYDYEGNVSGLIGVMLDITERKQAELALKDSEMKLRKLNADKDKYLSIINHELERAKEYLLSLLPDEIKDGKIQTQWSLIPSQQLGGDSFGYHWLDDNHLAIYLLDVSGHGIGAALHSVSILNALKLETMKDTDYKHPERVLASLNESFRMDEFNDMFFTIWYGVYNKENKILKFASGGHHPALLIEEGGKWHELHSSNCIIGAKTSCSFTDSEFKITKPSQLFVFSDGAFEIWQSNGKMWGFEGLCEFLIKNHNNRVNETEFIYNHAKEISKNNSLNDDYSMLKVVFYH